MAKTMMDGYPDDPWIDELSTEMNRIVMDAERRIASAPLIGRHLIGRALFERDRLTSEPEVFSNDPYYRTERIDLN